MKGKQVVVDWMCVGTKAETDVCDFQVFFCLAENASRDNSILRQKSKEGPPKKKKTETEKRFIVTKNDPPAYAIL